MGIAEPTADRHSVLRVENVAGGRVVDDDGFFQFAADLAQVFDVVSLMVVAALAEQSVVNDVVDVQLIQQRISIFGY